MIIGILLTHFVLGGGYGGWIHGFVNLVKIKYDNELIYFESYK